MFMRNRLARKMAAEMRGATCAGTQTSKAPTLSGPSVTNHYSVPPKFAIFPASKYSNAIVLFRMRKRISAKLSLRTRTSTHVLQNCFEVEARLVNMQNRTIMAKRKG